MYTCRTGEFSGAQSSSVELVESDEQSGVQSSSSSATTSSLLNRLRCSKSSERSRVKGRLTAVDRDVIMCHCKVSVFYA